MPDADRITPPVVEEGFRAGHDISITVTINAGLPIADLKSAQHEVKVEHPDGDKTRAVVSLAKKAVIPNRDFAISYRTAGDEITDTVLTHTDERGKFFTLVLQPPARVKQEQVVPRELVFVLDTSGSMSGFPMETSKAMMRRAIENLRPEDRFNLMTFAGSTSVLFPKPVAQHRGEPAQGAAVHRHPPGGGRHRDDEGHQHRPGRRARPEEGAHRLLPDRRLRRQRHGDHRRGQGERARRPASSASASATR